MPEDSAKQKEELVRLIGDARPEARKLQGIGQGLVEFARFTEDMVGPLAELVKQVGPDQLPSGDRPVVGDGGPVSVLVSLRECIDAVITELVRRRPRQETAKGWSGKVISVGSQCARPMLAADHFNRLSVDTELLMNELSGAKQADMSRERLSELFNRGLLFLNALMDTRDIETNVLSVSARVATAGAALSHTNTSSDDIGIVWLRRTVIRRPYPPRANL